MTCSCCYATPSPDIYVFIFCTTMVQKGIVELRLLVASLCSILLFTQFVLVELTNIDATHANAYKQDCKEKRGCICGNERSGGSSDDEAQ